jgi:hypothetical protein
VHQQLWGYKVEGKLYVGVREQKMLNTADITDPWPKISVLNVSTTKHESQTKLPNNNTTRAKTAVQLNFSQVFDIYLI